MKTITIDRDICILYVEAASFPAGIKPAFDKLHALVPMTSGRTYYGTSRPENGSIVYRAGVEELKPGEGGELDCKTLVIKKGRYIAEDLHDYMKDVTVMGRTFEQLLKEPGIDPQGYCVEVYKDMNEVRCMVRLVD